jgi:hypothetical protein
MPLNDWLKYITPLTQKKEERRKRKKKKEVTGGNYEKRAVLW